MARTKFLSADPDTTLGGNSASHDYVPSQKAVKTYVDEKTTDTKVTQNPVTDSVEHRILFTEKNSSETINGQISFNTGFTFNPDTGTVTAPKFCGDGSLLTGIVADMPAVAFVANAANTSNITFGSTHSYQTVSVTGTTQTFYINIPPANSFVNYLLVTNTGSSTCTVTLDAASGMTWTSFVLPKEAIEVEAGETIELSFISINNHTQLVVTKSAAMEVSSLS